MNRCKFNYFITLNVQEQSNKTKQLEDLLKAAAADLTAEQYRDFLLYSKGYITGKLLELDNKKNTCIC